MKIKNLSLVLALVIISELAQANYCEEFNARPTFEKAIQILAENSTNSSEIKIYTATIAEMHPNLGINSKGQMQSALKSEIRIESIPLGNINSQDLFVINDVVTDVGSVYFFDLKSKKWMNLGIASNCTYSSGYMTRTLLEKRLVPVYLDIQTGD